MCSAQPQMRQKWMQRISVLIHVCLFLFKLYSHGPLIIRDVVNILKRKWKCTCWFEGDGVRYVRDIVALSIVLFPTPSSCIPIGVGGSFSI